MSNFNYTTVDGAKYKYRQLAKDFCMPKLVFDKIEAAKTTSEVEHIWWAAIKQI